MLEIALSLPKPFLAGANCLFVPMGPLELRWGTEEVARGGMSHTWELPAWAPGRMLGAQGAADAGCQALSFAAHAGLRCPCLLFAAPSHCSCQHSLMLFLPRPVKTGEGLLKSCPGLMNNRYWGFQRGHSQTFLLVEFQKSSVQKWGCWKKRGASHNVSQGFCHSQEQRRQERGCRDGPIHSCLLTWPRGLWEDAPSGVHTSKARLLICRNISINFLFLPYYCQLQY